MAVSIDIAAHTSKDDVRESVASARAGAEGRRPWHGSAFIVESLFLLLFLVCSTAILVSLLSTAYQHSVQSERLARAIMLASNQAEIATGDPQPGQFVTYYSDSERRLQQTTEENAEYTVMQSTTVDDTAYGRMYHIEITVSGNSGDDYTLSTSVYQSDRGGGSNG